MLEANLCMCTQHRLGWCVFFISACFPALPMWRTVQCIVFHRPLCIDLSYLTLHSAPPGADSWQFPAANQAHSQSCVKQNPRRLCIIIIRLWGRVDINTWTMRSIQVCYQSIWHMPSDTLLNSLTAKKLVRLYSTCASQWSPTWVLDTPIVA